MSRRGSNAVEFALVLPLMLVLAAGVVDLGQYLYVAEGVVAAVAEGTRAGAMADPDDGEYPVATANTIATLTWGASDLPGTFTVDSMLAGAGAPNERLIVTGSVTFDPFFGFLLLPEVASYTHTIRLLHQP